jgi:hypothetical protein
LAIPLPFPTSHNVGTVAVNSSTIIKMIVASILNSPIVETVALFIYAMQTPNNTP